MKTYEVAVAAIVSDWLLLCTQRGPSQYDYIAHKFQFPGGTIESGEMGSEALKRALKKDLNLSLEITEDHHMMTVEHQYPDFKVILHVYKIEAENVADHLIDHIDHVWADSGMIYFLEWADADFKVMNKIIDEGLIDWQV